MKIGQSQFFLNDLRRRKERKMFDKVKEECGVFGIYAKEAKEDLIGQVCIGLSSLQHRGEESCRSGN